MGSPLSSLGSSPRNSTSMMRNSGSSGAWLGIGEDSADTMQSEIDRGVSIRNSVPISGVLARASASPVPSMRMTACAPVTATMRPMRLG